MARRDPRRPRVTGDHDGPGEQPGAMHVGDDVDSAGHGSDGTARSAEEHLASDARPATDPRASSGPGAGRPGEDTPAAAEQVPLARTAGEHRFEAMFHDHDAVMLLIDPETGEIVDANPAATTFYGYPIDVLRSMTIAQINALPADEVAVRLAQARSHGRGHFLFPHRLASGEIRRVDVHTSAIADGRPLLFSIIVDIEHRIRAEEQLAESERLYRMLSENADGAVLLVSPAGTVRWASPSIERLLGYTPAEIKSLDGAALVHPDDLVVAQAATPGGEAHGVGAQIRFRCKDGQYRWMSATSRTVTDPDGAVTGRIDALHDIHDEVLAVKALAEAEEESRLAFDRSSVATCLVSNDGRLLRVNPAICDLLGRSEDELLTLNFLEVTHPDDRARGAELVRDLVAGRRSSLRLTKRYLTGDGRVVWGDVTVSAVHKADGSVRHRIAQILDVTAEHTLQESLLEAQRIAHLGSWHSDLATGIVGWSPELYDMFGLDPTGPAPDYADQQSLFSPESWQRLTTAVAVTQATGTPYELELQSVRADGTRGWISARGEGIRDATGAIVELQGVSVDVTAHKEAANALAASEELLRVVLDTSSDATIRIGIDGRVEFVNHRVEELSGAPSEQWIGSTFAEMGYPAELALSWDAKRGTVFATGTPVTFEFEIDNADGHRWYETTVAPQRDATGSVAHVIETSRDITERRTGEAALKASRAQLEQAQRIAHVGSWTLDNASGHVTWSEELFLMQGLDPTGEVPDHIEHSRLFTPASWQELSTALPVTQRTGTPYELELEMVRPDGSHGWMLARGEAVRDTTGAIVGLQGVARDITERKASSDALKVLATHDPLTGLANRAMLLDEVSRALNAGRRSGGATAVLMMDLDRFKFVNDTLGHATGDHLLVAAAARIEKVVRAGDLVARLGGDEFVVVLRDLADPTDAVRAAGHLVEAFRTPFTRTGAELFTTASVGVAIATEASDAGDLLREADTAMYAAKEAGRNRVAVFNEDLRTAVIARQAVEADLRHALERGRLAVWYQPEVDLVTGTVVAMEALLRWHHPDGTVWTADRFIDVAEDTGLILGIGEWALHQACTQGAAWAAARPDRPRTVRVNVSAHQLAETGLLAAVDDSLTTSGLDPRLLCLEITETALLRQTTTARDNLTGVHDRGIGIALDDFGTGYASLAYLRQYPIDVLKIDRTFITDLTAPDHDDRLVAGIIALAHGLGIAVTAEGVEHPDQAIRLRQLGCPTAQGWLYSKARPPEDVIPILDRTYPHP